MKRPLALALSVLITTSVVAQTDSTNPKPKTAHHSSSTPVSKTLEDMKDAISAQQQQIQQLQQQIASRDQAIQQLQQQIANLPAPAAPPPAAPNCCDEVGALQHDVTDLKTVSGNTVNELQETQKRVSALWRARWPFTTRESPLLRVASWRQKLCGVSARRERTSIRNSTGFRTPALLKRACLSSMDRAVSLESQCWPKATSTR